MKLPKSQRHHTLLDRLGNVVTRTYDPQLISSIQEFKNFQDTFKNLVGV